MILASGAFDGLHSGHVAYLYASAALDPSMPLVVAVAPDQYIRDAKHRAPRWTQQQRAETVAAIRGVSRVLAQAEVSIAATIRQLRPALVVKGIDWLGRIPRDVAEAVVAAGAGLAFVETDQTHGAEVAWR